MKISIIGCGRWGSFQAWYANQIHYEVMLYGRKSSNNFKRLLETRCNDELKLPNEVKLTSELEEAVTFCDVVIISIGTQQLRNFLKELKCINQSMKKKYVLCMKGLESVTGKRLSEVFKEEMFLNCAVWIGPGHVQDFLKGIPNCMLITSADEELTKELVEVFKSRLIRFYYGKDLIGSEIGAASKNVIGLAAGILDGLNYSSLKGALMARGTAELSRLIEAVGGDKMTVYGLSHLGDYEATLFSKYSHNRQFGEKFVLKQKYEKLAEGVETVKALMKLSSELGVELPICGAVNAIIHEKKNPEEQLLNLLLRATKTE